MRDEAEMRPKVIIPPSPSVYSKLTYHPATLAVDHGVAVPAGPCVYDAGGRLSLGDCDFCDDRP